MTPHSLRMKTFFGVLLFVGVAAEDRPCSHLEKVSTCYAGGEARAVYTEDEEVELLEFQPCLSCGYWSDATRPGRWFECAACVDGSTLVPLDDDCTGACVRNDEMRAFAESFGGAPINESACLPHRACFDEDVLPPVDETKNQVFPVVEGPEDWAWLVDVVATETVFWDDADAVDDVVEWEEDDAEEVDDTPGFDSWLVSLFQSARDADVSDSRAVRDMWFGSVFFEAADDAESGDSLSWSLFHAVPSDSDAVDSSDQGLWPLTTALRLARGAFFTSFKDESYLDASTIDEFGGDFEGAPDFIECPPDFIECP